MPRGYGAGCGLAVNGCGPYQQYGHWTNGSWNADFNGGNNPISGNAFAPGACLWQNGNIISGNFWQIGSSQTFRYGTGGDDILYGGSEGDVIWGRGGNDILYGAGGNDVLYGGLGDDILIGESGNDTLHGGIGNDIMYGGEGNDVFLWAPGCGTDVIVESTVDAGEDSLIVAAASSLYVIKAGNDLALGTAPSQWVVVSDYFQDPGLENIIVCDKSFESSQIAELAVDIGVESLPVELTGLNSTDFSVLEPMPIA